MMKNILVARFIVLILGVVAVAFGANTLQSSHTLAQVSPLPTPESAELIRLAEINALAIQEYKARHPESSDKIEIAASDILEFPLTGRTVARSYVLDMGTANTMVEGFHFDFETLTLVNDIEQIEMLEHEAVASKYGNLSPDLYDRFSSTSSDDTIRVGIWLSTFDESKVSTQAIADADAAVSLKRDFDLNNGDDLQKRHELERAWTDAFAASYSREMDKLTAKFTEDMKALGIEVLRAQGMPLVFTELTPKQAEILSQRSDIDKIYRADDVAIYEQSIANPTLRISQTWMRTDFGQILDGNAMKIGIYEPQSVSSYTAGCTNIIATRTPAPNPTPVPTPQHKNLVAAIVGCNDATYRGVAHASSLIDIGYADHLGDAERINALNWAVSNVSPRPAYVINASVGYGTGNSVDLLDRAFDYVSFLTRRTFIKSAGNSGANGNVTTPGKAYNVITVGNMDDLNTGIWSDDVIAMTSSSLNPSNGLEKPELVASGQNISTVDGPGSGTSFAAPFVTGVTALMMQRNGILQEYPSAVKAVLMASAVHNVDGATLSDSTLLDERDGAGALNAALADTISQSFPVSSSCYRSCTAVYQTGSRNPSSPSTYITIRSVRGEQVRVAISWMAKANSDSTYSGHGLKSNYDLYVRNTGNMTLAFGVNMGTSNYNIVEFTAPYTGDYFIELRRTQKINGGTTGADDSDTLNYLGVAFTRQGLYAPEVQRNATWESKVFFRNEEPTQRTVELMASNADSSSASGFGPTLNRNGSSFETAPAPPNPLDKRTMVVNGYDDVTAIHSMVSTSGSTATNSMMDNLFHPAGFGDPEFERASSTLYAPAIYKNIYSTAPSIIELMNVGTSATTPVVDFYGRVGTNYGHVNVTLPSIPAGGRLAYDLIDLAFPSPWIGSAVINASQPLAGRVVTTDYYGPHRYHNSYNLGAAGYRLAYSPVGYKNSYNYFSGIIVQNLGLNDLTVDVHFRDFSGTLIATTQIKDIPQYKSGAINTSSTSLVFTYGSLPTSWQGSIAIQSTSTNSNFIAEIVNTRTVAGINDGAYATTAVGQIYGGRSVVLPYVARSWESRTTAYFIRNIAGGSSANNVRITYFNPNGTPVNSQPLTVPISPGGTHTQWQGADPVVTNNGWRGSVAIDADGPIVVIVREDNGAMVSGYNGVVVSP